MGLPFDHEASIRNNKSILSTLYYLIHFIYIYHAPVHTNVFNPFPLSFAFSEAAEAAVEAIQASYL